MSAIDSSINFFLASSVHIVFLLPGQHPKGITFFVDSHVLPFLQAVFGGPLFGQS
jgi:hypothetical protein